MKILIFDIETLLEYFLVGIYMPEQKEYIEFSVNKNVNELYTFIKWAEDHNDYYWVGFNNLSFDLQVIEKIIRNAQKWKDMSNLEVAAEICTIAANIIDDTSHDLNPPYWESDLSLNCIDLFKIHHFDNKNKRTSLKWCEFSMKFDSMEDMPIHYLQIGLTDKDLADVRRYCRNDVMATNELYNWTIGISPNPEYAGKDKIQDRLNLMEETGLPCLNWSDVTIGEEWNRKDYTALTGRKGRDLYPKKVRHFFGMKYRDFFPPTVEFQTEKVKKFVKDMGDTYILNKKQQFKIELGGNTIALGKGGIHSNEGPRFLQSDEQYQYIQVDIGSQYPNAYKKYGLFPLHLGKSANDIIVQKIRRRLNDKAMYKKTKDTKYKSLEEMGKLALNGGLYGKLKQKGSFLEDHVCQLKITIGCQLEILMIVEALIQEGHRVVSLNTDGFDVLIERRRMDEFRALCAKYEEKIGNSGEGNGNLEFTNFDWIAQLSVSGYLAKKEDGDLKKKKDFNTDFLLNENPSKRVVPLALEAYYDRGIEPEDFIPSHQDIHDFCIGIKSTKDYTYKIVDRETTIEEIVDERASRYYVSNTGYKLLKIKREGSDATGNDVQECVAPEDGEVWLCRIANKIDRNAPIQEYDINYEYYIRKARHIIAQIKAKKKVVKKSNPNQISLF